MTIVLALAWRPDAATTPLFEQLYPAWQEIYDGISIVTPPEIAPPLVERLTALDQVKVMVRQQPRENRRYLTLQHALTFDGVDYVHYCDGDHALNRFERNPDEWRHGLAALYDVDCLIIGRSPGVLASYPAALQETERIINLVGSHLLGQPADFGSGARGFSRAAVDHILTHDSVTSHPIVNDLSWPVMLDRAGFDVHTYESDAAYYTIESEAKRAVLEQPEQWQKRVRLAHAIIQAGIEASSRSYE